MAHTRNKQGFRRLPRGVRKYLRYEKSRLRREHSDPDARARALEALSKRFHSRNVS